MDEKSGTETKTHWTRAILGFSILILLGCISLAIYFYSSIEELEKPGDNQLQTITTQDPRIKNRASTEKLSPEEYNSEVIYYVGILKKEDPRVSLTELRKNIETDKALLRSCHAITHELGWEAYKKYEDFDKAMEYLDEVCNTGYMHGVIEVKFAGSSDINADLKTVCVGHDEGRCMHGVGHGVMFYSTNDLPKSLSMCESFDLLSSEQYCAEGVFMENFSTDQKLHPSKYLSEDNFFYPCGEQKVRYKYSCYYYAPLFYLAHEHTYPEAIQWCNEAEANFINNCIRGVAAVVTKQNIGEPKLIEAICNSADPKRVASCIDGMIGIYLNHYNSLDKALQICDTLIESNKKACISGAKTREGNFNGEVKGLSIPI
jgi:hypothetical protein